MSQFRTIQEPFTTPWWTWLPVTEAMLAAPSRSSLSAHMFSLVPHLLGHEWYDKDPQLARDCQATLSCLSRAQHSPATVPSLVAAMETSLAAASWKTRVSCLDFLQAVIFNNFMLFCSSNVARGSSLRSCVISMVMKCLDDDQIEVRVKAAQVKTSK